ncbi:RDD family protein [Streptomyces sp. H10-C2]|uniref:RDD family protein n=1 Tax=unclassified Streptomyces TaxID=2593676 RepID=UPI0024B8802A|nr:MULTISPECIES: RDD family protein [unclassified Streptomyces]MDJ0344381.1 RDD family protein [Streptomyces sp. PH10-H1]MDJ0373750.1 RDD family protein [Streptomyces sp. H10-C2]
MGSPSSGSSGSPVPGYYPDPSIPGYIRYWNGAAWVPGTSRPAPRPGEELTAPSGPAAPGPGAAGPGVPGPGSGPASGGGAHAPGVDESGVMFFDEDPAEPAGPATPAAPERGSAAPVWSATPAVEPPRTTWGATGPQAAEAPATPASGAYPGGPTASGTGSQAVNLPAARGGSAPAGTPTGTPSGTPTGAAPWGTQPQPQPGPGESEGVRRGGPAPLAQAAPTPWAQQVHELARQGTGGTGAGTGAGAGTGTSGGTGGSGVVAVPAQAGDPAGAAAAGVVPWRPPVSDPFAAMVQEQGRPAGLGRRLAARLLDTLVVLAATAAAAVPLGTAAYHHLKDKVNAARLTGENVTVWLIDGTTGLQLGIVLAVGLVAGLLYEVLPTATWGRTLGKKLFGLRVIDIESQLAPGFGAALRRWLTHTLLDALVIGFVGLAWCLFDRPWRQCWHDKAARTFVARQ